MKPRQLGIIISSIILFSSCASHFGNITSSTVINDGNFKVVGFAIGTASTNKVFGLGGTKRENLVLDAKRNLYKHYPLKNGEVLSNLTLDFVNKRYPFFSQVKVTVSGEIISFNNSQISSNYSINSVLSSDIKFENRGYYLNEEVYVENGLLYEMYKISKISTYEIEVISKKNNEKKVVTYQKLFKVEKDNFNKNSLFKVGANISYTLEDSDQIEIISKGKIKVIGVNKKYIVEYESSGNMFNVIIDESQIEKQGS